MSKFIEILNKVVKIDRKSPKNGASVQIESKEHEIKDPKDDTKTKKITCDNTTFIVPEGIMCIEDLPDKSTDISISAGKDTIKFNSDGDFLEIGGIKYSGFDLSKECEEFANELIQVTDKNNLFILELMSHRLKAQALFSNTEAIHNSFLGEVDSQLQRKESAIVVLNNKYTRSITIKDNSIELIPHGCSNSVFMTINDGTVKKLELKDKNGHVYCSKDTDEDIDASLEYMFIKTGLESFNKMARTKNNLEMKAPATLDNSRTAVDVFEL